MGTLAAVLLGLTIESCGQTTHGDEGDTTARDATRCAVTQPLRFDPAEVGPLPTPTKPKKPKAVKDVRIVCTRVLVNNSLQLSCKLVENPTAPAQSKSAAKQRASATPRSRAKSRSERAPKLAASGKHASQRRARRGTASNAKAKKGDKEKRWIPEPVPFGAFGR